MMCFSQSRRNSASVSPADDESPRYKRSHHRNAVSRSSMISRMSELSVDETYHGRRSSRLDQDSGRIFLRRHEGTNIFHDRYGNEVPQVSWKVPVSIIDPTLNYHTSIGRVSRMSPANHMITRSRLNSSGNFRHSNNRSRSKSDWQEEEDARINEIDDTFSIESMTSLEKYVEDIGLSDSEDDDKPVQATHGRKHSRH